MATSDPATPEFEDERIAFLFTDIEGSSVKWLRHTQAMHEALAKHDRLLRLAIETCRGEVFKTAGDSFYAAFASPHDAVEAAIAAQRDLLDAEWEDVSGLRVRMAVDYGLARRRSDDYFGPALNRCARLLNLGHGGQVLLTASAAEGMDSSPRPGVGVRIIGTNPLDDPEQPQPIHQLVVDGLPHEFPGLRDTTAVANNLPQWLPTLVGRSEELAQLQSLVGARRWVTLCGPGGVGKTRLALEVAAGLVDSRRGGEVADRFRSQLKDGVWVVELAAVGDPSLVESAIASQLGIDLAGGRQAGEELANRLANRGLLIVLDNCEHLLGGVAEVGQRLLARCTGVHILATSQEPVAVAEEAVVQVQILGLPVAESPSAAQALGSPAVMLFVARAAAADAQFSLDDRNVLAVCTICRRLDGIPLAIEMAAARVGVMGPAELAKRLDHRFRLLKNSQRAGVARHQTLRTTIDWSFELLADRERVVLRRLSVFAGGFSLDAACSIAGDTSIDEFEVIDAIGELTRRSLLAADLESDWPRYRMMETIRAYGAEKLAECEEAPAAAANHVNFYRALMERCWSESFNLSDALLRDAYGPDLDNVRAALDWAFDHAVLLGEGLAMLGACEPLFTGLALLPELRRRMEAGIDRLADGPLELVSARIWVGLGLARGFSNPRAAFDALAVALPFWRATGDDRMLGSVLVFMGRYAQVVTSQAAKSGALIAEAEPVIARCSCARLRGQYYRAKGNEAAALHRFDESVLMLRRSCQAFREAGAESAASGAFASLGYMLWASGDLEGGIQICRQALAEIRARPFPDGPVLGFTLGNLAGMLTERGDLPEAGALFAEVAPLLHDPWQLWVIFDHLALHLAKSGSWEEAATAAGFTDAQYAAHGAQRQPNEQRAHDAALAILRGRFDAAVVTGWLESSWSLSEDAAVAMAQNGRSSH